MSEEKKHTQTKRVPTARDIDVLYRESDRLYYELARDCGLTDTAYWVLYQIVSCGGKMSQRELTHILSYSRQTINSCLKSLEGRGMIEMNLEEGSHKYKIVALTASGSEFCERMIVPAMKAEERAFNHFSLQDKKRFVEFVSLYAQAIDSELERMKQIQAHDATEMRR